MIWLIITALALSPQAAQLWRRLGYGVCYGAVYGFLGQDVRLWSRVWGYGVGFGVMGRVVVLWGGMWGYGSIYGVMGQLMAL